MTPVFGIVLLPTPMMGKTILGMSQRNHGTNLHFKNSNARLLDMDAFIVVVQNQNWPD